MTVQNHELGELDILCSKDKSLSTHPGNRLFRELIEEAKAPYKKAIDKATKMKITKNIVDRLHNDYGCRFVKFDTDLAFWVELSRIESRDKVGHALRFAIKGAPKKSLTRRRRSSATKMAHRSKSSEDQRSSITRTSCSSTIASIRPSTKGNSSLLSSGLSIDRIETARGNLDLIFKRQQELLLAFSNHVDERTTEEHSASCQEDPGMNQSEKMMSPSLMEPLDLDSAEVADILTADEFNFFGGSSDHVEL